MGWLLEQVKETFTERGWSFRSIENAEVIEAGFEAHHTRVHLHVQVFVPLHAVSVVSQAGRRIDQPDRRAKLAELLMRSNEQLNLGNFEMLWDEGEAVFRATNIFPRDTFDRDILGGLVETTIVEMDRMAPCLSYLSQVSPVDLLTLDVMELLQREDWIPPVPEPSDKPA